MINRQYGEGAVRLGLLLLSSLSTSIRAPEAKGMWKKQLKDRPSWGLICKGEETKLPVLA